MLSFHKIFVLLFSAIISATVAQNFDPRVCALESKFTAKIRDSILSKTDDLNRIFDFVINGADKGVTYDELGKFVDTFGSRHAGSQSLENSIDYMVDLLKNENHDNVFTENVTMQKWTRGEEWAKILTPYEHKMNILGLGGSVGTTGAEGLTAQVIVVRSFDELTARASEVPGKIVAYNFEYTSYSAQSSYRSQGATRAAAFGAVAVLVRSLAPLSINSPHTGNQNNRAIPAVSITIEDAELLYRLSLAGNNITVQIYLDDRNEGPVISRNVLSDIIGTEFPQQLVMVSGHIDSWDVGSGAMDDGGGIFIAWRALSVLKKLGLSVRRTVRAALWTAEEIGLVGAASYVNQHASELSNISIILESDIGTFTPIGVSISGSNTLAHCIVNEALQLLRPIRVTQLYLGTRGSDISNFISRGVPGTSLLNADAHYFYYHHTDGDTLTVEDSGTLDLCTATWASLVYLFANLDEPIPRN